jgi:hypothetical protein
MNYRWSQTKRAERNGQEELYPDKKEPRRTGAKGGHWTARVPFVAA